MKTGPIVVGVDGKQSAALRFAADEAAIHDRLLRVVHCVEPPIFGDVSAATPRHAAYRGRQKTGQQILDAAHEIVDSIQPTLPTTYSLVRGAPTGLLRDEAERAAMVVVGTDPARWVDRISGGRVAAYVAKRSQAPVAIVPEPSWLTPLVGGIFVAVETGGLATDVLRIAFTEASHRGRELHVFHPVPEDTNIHEVNEERRRMAIQLSGWSEKYPDVKVTRAMVFDEEDHGCLHATEAAALLVLGRSPGPKITLPWNHPVLNQIARHARCPSIVVPLSPDESDAPHEFGGAKRFVAPF